MRVWVMECGCYAERYFAGVYATAEAAMRAWDESHNKDQRYHWEMETFAVGGWTNEGDWEDAVRIFETEVRS